MAGNQSVAMSLFAAMYKDSSSSESPEAPSPVEEANKGATASTADEEVQLSVEKTRRRATSAAVKRYANDDDDDDEEDDDDVNDNANKEANVADGKNKDKINDSSSNKKPNKFTKNRSKTCGKSNIPLMLALHSRLHDETDF